MFFFEGLGFGGQGFGFRVNRGPSGRMGVLCRVGDNMKLWVHKAEWVFCLWGLGFQVLGSRDPLRGIPEPS